MSAARDHMVVQLTVAELRDLIREELARAREPELLTLAAAAKQLSVSSRTISRWIADGMPSQGEGKLRRVRLEDCRRWLEKGEEPPEDAALRIFRGGR